MRCWSILWAAQYPFFILPPSSRITVQPGSGVIRRDDPSPWVALADLARMGRREEGGTREEEHESPMLSSPLSSLASHLFGMQASVLAYPECTAEHPLTPTPLSFSLCARASMVCETPVPERRDFCPIPTGWI